LSGLACPLAALKGDEFALHPGNLGASCYNYGGVCLLGSVRY